MDPRMREDDSRRHSREGGNPSPTIDPRMREDDKCACARMTIEHALLKANGFSVNVSVE
jgi:hypothetical protein